MSRRSLGAVPLTVRERGERHRAKRAKREQRLIDAMRSALGARTLEQARLGLAMALDEARIEIEPAKEGPFGEQMYAWFITDPSSGKSGIIEIESNDGTWQAAVDDTLPQMEACRHRAIEIGRQFYHIVSLRKFALVHVIETILPGETEKATRQ